MPMSAGLDAGHGRRHDARQRPEPQLAGHAGFHEHAAPAPSLMPELLPAVTVPPSRKAGLQSRQPLDGGVRAGVLVAVDDERLALAAGARSPARSRRRSGRPRWRPRRAAGCASAKASWSSRVTSSARPRSRPSRPSSTGGAASASAGLAKRQPRVVSTSSRLPRSKAVSALSIDVGRAGHRLHAAGHEHVAVADHDRVGGRVDRLEAGAAQPVDGLAGDLDGEAGQQAGHARHVAVVLAGLVGAAEDHVVDAGGVDAGLGHSGPDGQRGQVVGAHGAQRAAVAADGRAHGGDDPRLAQGAVEGPGHAAIVGRTARRPGTPRPRRPTSPPGTRRRSRAAGRMPRARRWAGGASASAGR